MSNIVIVIKCRSEVVLMNNVDVYKSVVVITCCDDVM